MSGNSDYIPALRFRWLTRFYDVIVRVTTRERAFKSLLIQQSRPAVGSRLLDVGCGTATLTLWIKERHPGVSVTGLDGDAEALAIASRKAGAKSVAIELTQGFSYAMPYADSSFDQVVTSLFFHHLTWQDKLRTAREMLRVLRPGGELHVADWGRPSNSLMKTLFLVVQALDGFATTRDHAQGRLAQVFTDAGFAATRVTQHLDTPLGTIELLSARKP